MIAEAQLWQFIRPWKQGNNLVLTSNQGESAQTGEGADIDFQEVEGFAKVKYAVQPIAEATLTLLQREDNAVAEDQLRVVRVRAVRQPEHKQF